MTFDEWAGPLAFLVVSRDITLRVILDKILRERWPEAQIIVLESRARLLEYAARASVKAIILDADPPEMDWQGALSSVRELHAEIPLVILGDPSQERSVDALLGGADFYIDKPFNYRELTARLNTLLRRYRH